MTTCARKRHPLRIHTAAPIPPQWPSYTGQSQFVGTTPVGRVTVYVDPSLGNAGLVNAQALLVDADRIVAANDAIFGTSSGPTQVIVFALDGKTDGTGGADHGGCSFQDGAAIECCVALGQPARLGALYEAELSECCMGGNLCGYSTGEALSRWCAAVTSNNALGDFATAPTWFQQGAPNFVDTTDPSDQNPVSTGCGMAFLSWLMGPEGFKLPAIAQAMVALGDAGTLAQLYARLTSQPAGNAWQLFSAALRMLQGVVDDDPFKGSAPPPPPPPPPAPPLTVFDEFIPQGDVHPGRNLLIRHLPVGLKGGQKYGIVGPLAGVAGTSQYVCLAEEAR